jgi:hypothetical protein
MLPPLLTLDYSMCEHTYNVFAAYSLKRAGMANLGNMQKITG